MPTIKVFYKKRFLWHLYWITCKTMCLSIILCSSLRFTEKAAFQLSLSFTIIHLIEIKTHSWNKNSFICFTLLSVVSSLLSIRYNQPFISFTSCENEPFIGWKSNPTRRKCLKQDEYSIFLGKWENNAINGEKNAKN